ncbi:hypothetical protein OAA60_03455 [Porticoccaceae bacterium]|nr:hypothetical protein [Porticoccaceae bacterium]
MSIRNKLLQDILSAIGGGGSVQWGSIDGDIMSQTDLQSQLEDTTALNSVVINSESDFDVQDATTITLTPGLFYAIGANITTSKRFITQGAVMQGLTSATTLTYTGAGSMFTNTNGIFRISSMYISCPNATVFETIGDGSGDIFHRINGSDMVILACTQFLKSTDAGAHIFDVIQVSSPTGLKVVEFLGTAIPIVFSFDRMSFLGMSAGAVGFDFGTIQANEIEMTNLIMTGDATCTAASGVIDSGNITTGNLGMVSNCNFSSFTNQLSGIDVEDVRWEFKGNAGLSDSINDGLIHTSENILQTTTVGGARVKANAVFVDDDLGRFSSDGLGRLTYIGERGARLPIDLSATIRAASGGDKQVDLCIALNGSPITATCVQETASGTKAASASTIWQHNFVPGDYVEPFIANLSNDISLIMTQAVFRVN